MDGQLGLTLLVPQITWVLLGSGKLENKCKNQSYAEVFEGCRLGIYKQKWEDRLQILPRQHGLRIAKFKKLLLQLSQKSQIPHEG